MGDSRASPGFGQVDLDLDDDGLENEPPESASRSVGAKEPNTGVTRRSASVHDESTRVVAGDVLASITRPPPAFPQSERTRAWAEIDEQLLSVGAPQEDDAPISSGARTGSASASGSGIATRDDRVAAMRELYAKGDADGALALAATLSRPPEPPRGQDYPDASVIIEFGEDEISDPFGGLIPLDDEGDELSSKPTVVPPQPPLLTLTERHSIPRVLKSPAEVAKLPIDHRAGFLLAHVDGMQTLEEILDICAMPPVEALDLIGKLREMGVIEFE
ncbi:MAG: hypothetical protein KF819_20105 [Labilithrix sp.]|nr:hypothetical protein [Labilithrix sp.]